MIVPSNRAGKRLRAYLKPIAYLIAFMFVLLILYLISVYYNTSVLNLLSSHELSLLIVVLPGFILGKSLGLIAINLISYVTPVTRNIFEKESNETDRHNFLEATLGLVKFALFLFVIELICVYIFFYIS